MSIGRRKKKPDQIDIVEWFDVNNLEHLRAYKQMEDTGMWPLGFLPERIYFSELWQGRLQIRLVTTYIDMRLTE